MDPNNSQNLQFEDGNIDINRYIGLFISNWYWFATSLFVAIILAYCINRYSEKIWTVSSSLLISDNQPGGITSNSNNIIAGSGIFRGQQNLKNEIGILKSYMLNLRVMEELDEFHVIYIGVGRRRIVESRIYKKAPFQVIYKSLEAQPKYVRLMIELISDTTYRLGLNGKQGDSRPMRFGERFCENGFDFAIEPRFPGSRMLGHNSSDTYLFYFVDPENLANEYRSKLNVGLIEKDASLLYLSVSGFDPAQESDYLNKLMEIYTSYGREFKNETAINMAKFIEDQIGIISDTLKETEHKMAQFREKNNFFDPSKESTIIQGKFNNFDIDKARFELTLQYYNYLSNYLKAKEVGGGIISPSVIGISDNTLIRLLDELSELQNEKADLSFNFEINQPAIELIDRKAEVVKEKLRENVSDGIAGIRLSISELDKKIANVEEEFKILPSTEMEYIKVQREFDINNTVYTYLLEKRAETGIAKASIVADNRIIDKASQRRAVLVIPTKRKNFLMALLLGFLIPMAGIFIIDFLNDKVIDRRDIEKKTGVPIIGYISHSDGKSEMVVIEKPGSALAESFRAIRTSLKYYVKENDKSVVAVSSTISSEGKTFISINLAAITALLGKKVLLIGLDMRKPRLNKIFEFPDSPGMSTYLSGNCAYEDVIKETNIKNLYYAPSGPIPPNPSELIETEQMKKFMETVSKDFDFIIIDTPPVAIVIDALLLAPYVDINIYVTRQRYTACNTLDIVEHLNKQGELKNMAIVINDINLSGYYGYGMRYKYSLGYGYTYGYNYYGKGYYGKYGNKNKNKEYYSDES